MQADRTFEGGFVGYWIAKDRFAGDKFDKRCFGGSWSQRHRQPVLNEQASAAKVNEGDTAADFAAFQAWKQDQQQQSNDRSAFQADFKAAAMENADKALDSVLAQVQSLKAVCMVAVPIISS